MPLNISDSDLRAMRMTEAEARVEIAARLFDAGRLSFGHAAALAQVSEDRLEEELRLRDIPRYRYTEEDLRRDAASINRSPEITRPTVNT